MAKTKSSGSMIISKPLALILILISVIVVSAVTVMFLQYASTRSMWLSQSGRGGTSVISGAKVVYEHPKLGYTISYPSEWRTQIYKSPAGAAVQPYPDFIVYSPDYLLKESGGGSSVLLQGASIFVRGLDVAETTIEEKFAKNYLAKRIASSVDRISINGVPAIQYSYSSEGENATNTTLIKNGKWYLLKYEYANDSDKKENLKVYQQVLDSFSTK